MGTFAQHLTIEHLPEDLRGVFGILEEVDSILHLEGELVTDEDKVLETHRRLLGEVIACWQGKPRVLAMNLVELIRRLQELRSEIQWIETELKNLERRLKTIPVAEWDPAPFLRFLRELSVRLQFEGKELYREEHLFSEFNKSVSAARKEGMSAENFEDLRAIIRFLVDHSTRLFRLQQLIIDTISLVG